MHKPLLERVVERIKFTGTCWLWTSPPDTNGYGRIHWEYRFQRAHRVVYELLVGPIPEGLTIDHLCRVRLCVNPDHLEPVTRAENIRRRPSRRRAGGESTPTFPDGAIAARTHCRNGHAYAEYPPYVYRGTRYCTACRRLCAQRKLEGSKMVRSPLRKRLVILL